MKSISKLLIFILSSIFILQLVFLCIYFKSEYEKGSTGYVLIATNITILLACIISSIGAYYGHLFNKIDEPEGMDYWYYAYSCSLTTISFILVTVMSFVSYGINLYKNFEPLYLFPFVFVHIVYVLIVLYIYWLITNKYIKKIRLITTNKPLNVVNEINNSNPV
jgi:hypothetical protein